MPYAINWRRFYYHGQFSDRNSIKLALATMIQNYKNTETAISSYAACLLPFFFYRPIPNNPFSFVLPVNLSHNWAPPPLPLIMSLHYMHHIA